MESCACAQKPMNSSVNTRNARRVQAKRFAGAVSRCCAASATVSPISASAMMAQSSARSRQTPSAPFASSGGGRVKSSAGVE